jgi:hypothetical protein
MKIMEKFIVESRNGDDFIVSVEYGFTLRVIADNEQNEGNYEPGRIVGAIYAEDLLLPWPERLEFQSADDFEQAVQAFRTSIGLKEYDFEGLDIQFADNDVKECNKDLWFDAIEFYSELKLNKTLVALNAYGYEYDYSVKNSATETILLLNGKISPDYNLN